MLGALRWSVEITSGARARFLNRPSKCSVEASTLMGDDVGNDAGHDIGLAVNDDDALPPDEIKKVGVSDT